MVVALGSTFFLISRNQRQDPTVATEAAENTIGATVTPERPAARTNTVIPGEQQPLLTDRLEEDDTTDSQSPSQTSVQPTDSNMRLVPGSDLQFEDVEKLTGRDWLALNQSDRKAVLYALSLIVVLTDQNIDAEGALPMATFLDAFYSNAGNRNTGIYAAADAYLSHARGIVLQTSGNGNKATDSFYYPGDGYLLFQPKGSGEAAYSISVYDHTTTRIVKANVLMRFEGAAEQEVTRLRMPPGTYYFEVTSTIPWEVTVINQRGLEWLKRTVNQQQNAKEVQ